MRQTLSLVLMLLTVTQLGPAAFGADTVTSQITGTPSGANIEVRLKNKQRLRGTRGEVSGSGFTLVNPGAGDRQIAFDDVSSVKQLNRHPHTTRNVLILLGIVVVGAVGVLAINCATHHYC
jgi:hypothetical protein